MKKTISTIEGLNKLEIGERPNGVNTGENLHPNSPNSRGDDNYETPEHTPIHREEPGAPKRKREDSPNESAATQISAENLAGLTLPENLGQRREQGNNTTPRLAPRRNRTRRRLF